MHGVFVLLSSRKAQRAGMPFYLRTGRLTPTLIARIMIVAMLAFALVSGIVHPGVASSGHLCTMACCAGKPPHEAGSCMQGACHAHLSIRKPPVSKEQAEVCDGHNPQMAQHEAMQTQDAPAPFEETVSRSDHLHQQPFDSLAREPSQQDDPPKTNAADASMLMKQCSPDCGAGTLSGSSQSRPRSSVAISEADRPRPPSRARLPHTSDNPAKELEALCQRSRPRGPPRSFSWLTD
jgi:hypothetical protein